MKVEIEDIKRIVLEPNEVLVIRVPSQKGKAFRTKINDFLEGLSTSDHSLKGRVIAISDDIKLEAVTKK